MRILMIGPVADVRGPMPRIVQLITGALERRGCRVEVAHWGQRRRGESTFAKLVGRSRDAARLVALRMRRNTHDLAMVHSAHDLRALLREIPLVLGANLHELPIYYMFHGTAHRSSSTIEDRLWRMLFGVLVRRMAGVFVLSQEERDLIERWYPGVRVWATRYPFCAQPTDSRQRATEGVPTFAFVGRLIADKGIFELLQALSIVVQQTPCRLVVCGDGPALLAAREHVRAAGLTNQVEFRGWQSATQVWDVMQSVDALVLPSVREGFPAVLLEGMSAGLPIVTTPVGGIPDYLRDGVHALFAPPRDAAALARRMIDLLDDPALQARMSQANLALVREFAPDRVVADYLLAFGSRD